MKGKREMNRDEIAANLAAMSAPQAQHAGLYRSLVEIAADEPVVDGVLTGMSKIDRLTAGIRPGKLNLVGGYSGNGKTAFMLSVGMRNMSEASPFLYITSDDSDDAIMLKALSMYTGVPLDEVEAAGPEWRAAIAADLEGQLLIAAPQRSSSYSIDEVQWLYEEITQVWQRPPRVACFDYLSLLSLGPADDGGLGSIKAKASRMKALARKTSDTVWMIGHQCKKEAGTDCQALSLNHLEYGGHQEADGVVIGCRRRLTTTKLPDWEMELEESTPTTNVSVMKNKITGRTSPDPRGTSYVIDSGTGMLREYTDAEQRARERKGSSTAAGPMILRFPGRIERLDDSDD